MTYAEARQAADLTYDAYCDAKKADATEATLERLALDAAKAHKRAFLAGMATPKHDPGALGDWADAAEKLRRQARTHRSNS